ncbi:ATP-grasp domain-containing protein [Streptomyces sp. C11-1]|uniref:ATP-grasp domain-containing protein n=1 Tax=Streptomyces durocortorensis TaxID=2811104 RepID=A0ABY9VXU4_9ACTN|nr:ATP-grasp domain-containing protein [Streptomyces durocortorensis]WNF28004.1 ATP-grasp domain-containing protein [Streptomyces durocortorensis]
MDEFSAGFTGRLKRAVTGSPDTPLVFLGNFEVEEVWAQGEHTLPRFSGASGNAVVNRMDEFALLLAGEGDHVVLKTAPDEAYLAYLAELGLGLPAVHAVARQDSQRNVTEDVLHDPALLATLTELAGQGAHLTAHGISVVEEELSRRTGMPLAAPGAGLCKAVNSKIYSRRAADELGLRQPAGWTCETVDELGEALGRARELLAEGRRTVVKEAFGVSGKGIVVLENERRMDRVLRMVTQRVERSGQPRIAFVVEEWVPNQGDLNYQFTVGRDQSVHFDFVKRAVTEGGVHKGHRIPAQLSESRLAALREAAALLGKRLAADGYIGVVGVDALLDDADGVFPVIEINARNNMSTYQVRLQERLVGPGRAGLARHYPLRLNGPIGFEEMRRVLGPLLLTEAGGSGLVINNYATVNAGGQERPGEPFDGRLYGIVVADSATELTALDEGVTARLVAEGVSRAH